MRRQVTVSKLLHRIPIALGGILLGVSVVLYLVLDRLAVAEQAVSPGEDSFGVAALGMMFGPPIIVTAAGGLLALLVGLSFLLLHRFRYPD